MSFSFDFQINGDPATWADILARVSRTAKAAASATAGMGTTFERMSAEFRAHDADSRRRKVDDFIRWLAKHQDDGMVEV